MNFYSFKATESVIFTMNGVYGDEIQVLILCVCTFICVYEQVFCRGQRAI